MWLSAEVKSALPQQQGPLAVMAEDLCSFQKSLKRALTDIILHLSQLSLRGGQHSPLFLTPIPRTSEARLNRRASRGKLKQGAQERLLLTSRYNETAAQTLHTLLSCLEWKLFHLPRHFCWAGWVVFSRKEFSRISEGADCWLSALNSAGSKV